MHPKGALGLIVLYILETNEGILPVTKVKYPPSDLKYSIASIFSREIVLSSLKRVPSRSVQISIPSNFFVLFILYSNVGKTKSFAENLDESLPLHIFLDIAQFLTDEHLMGIAVNRDSSVGGLKRNYKGFIEF